MKNILLVLVSPKMGGAEKVVETIYSELKSELSFNFCFVSQFFKNKAFIAQDSKPFWNIFYSKYDIIHSHLFWSGLLVRLRKLWDSNFVWIHTIHYDDYQYLKFGKLKKWIDYCFIYPYVDELITVNNNLPDILSPLNARVIENSINLKRKHKEINYSSSQNSQNKLVLFCLANLRKEKGIDRLLSAIPPLLNKGVNLHLYIAGSGSEYVFLKKIINEHKLMSYVTMLGHLDNPDEIFKISDLFIMPSRSESFGLSILEASCWGLPLIASNSGHLSTLLKGGEFGKLVINPDNPQEFANDIYDVIQNISLYQEKSNTAFIHFSKRYSIHEMINQYRNIYQKSINKVGESSNNTTPLDINKKGVVMISPIITHSSGGLQQQINLQSVELSKRNFNVYLLQRRDISLNINSTKWNKWKHVNYWEVPSWSILGTRMNGILFIVFGLFILIRERKNYSVIHAHQLYSPTLLGVFAKLLLHKKLVVKVTAGGLLGEVNELKKLPFYKLRIFLFRGIDKIFALNSQILNELQESLNLPKEKIEIIPNSVAIPDIPWSYKAGKPTFKLIYTGRISAEKSLDTVLRGLTILNTTLVLIEFTILGDDFKDRACLHNLLPLINFLPSTCKVIFESSKPDVLEYNLNSDLFVLPSLSEGMSNSLLEAMALGMPVLASDIEANRYLIENYVNGFLFEQGNPESFAKQLRFIINDYIDQGQLLKKLGMRAREDMKKGYAPPIVVESIIRNYFDQDGAVH